MDKHRENEKDFDRKIQNEKEKNKTYISLGTTKAKTKIPPDFIGLSNTLTHFMYEVRKIGSLHEATEADRKRKLEVFLCNRGFEWHEIQAVLKLLLQSGMDFEEPC